MTEQARPTPVTPRGLLFLDELMGRVPNAGPLTRSELAEAIQQIEWQAGSLTADQDHRVFAEGARLATPASGEAGLRAALAEILRTVYRPDIDTATDKSYSALHLRCIEIAQRALAAVGTPAPACPDPEHPDGAYCVNTTGLPCAGPISEMVGASPSAPPASPEERP